MKKDIKLITIFTIITILIICFITLLYKMSKEDEENFNKCIENYSVNYCKKSIYGVY